MIRRRALKHHKAAKHQIEMVVVHFRNVYQVEALAQIQRYAARTGRIVPGFVRFEKIIQQENSGLVGVPSSLLEVREN